MHRYAETGLVRYTVQTGAVCYSPKAARFVQLFSLGRKGYSSHLFFSVQSVCACVYSFISKSMVTDVDPLFVF